LQGKVELFDFPRTLPPLLGIRLVARIGDSDQYLATIRIGECDRDLLNFGPADLQRLMIEKMILIPSN
jgi:hypothetical protein